MPSVEDSSLAELRAMEERVAAATRHKNDPCAVLPAEEERVRTADPQTQALHYQPSVVIVEGKIDSIWREPGDAASWAARLVAQRRSWGGHPSQVTVDQLPHRFSTIEVVARTAQDDVVKLAR